MSSEYRLTVTATSADTDELGHVNNVVYLMWAERIAREHGALLGFGLEDVATAGGVFVAKRHEIEYFRSALPGDLVELVTRVEAMSGARGLRITEFFRGEELLARIRTEWAFIDLSTGRPKRLPSHLQGAGT